jgi:8-oxo-dGTP diphosphatase
VTQPRDTSVVAGAAIVGTGRLLAARRVAPPSLAGGWELPGGKVEPGESAA